jgi:hypothetical protein
MDSEFWQSTFGRGDGQMGNAGGLAVAAGRLFCADQNYHRIIVLDLAPLRWRGAFGRKGSGDGRLKVPIGLAVVAEELFVADSQNHRLQVFSFDGAWRRTIGRRGTGPGQFQNLRGITALGERLIVAEQPDGAAPRLQVLTRDGVPMQVVALPISPSPHVSPVNFVPSVTAATHGVYVTYRAESDSMWATNSVVKVPVNQAAL